MNFAKAREAAGLTLTEAATRLGITPAAVYQWENGMTLPDAKRLAAIAELYGTTVDYLLSSADDTSEAETNDGADA